MRKWFRVGLSKTCKCGETYRYNKEKELVNISFLINFMYNEVYYYTVWADIMRSYK